ncbi:hypothetical protein TL16_g03391 [Triparma laevis f. inornata]|uniref:Uncharacterized protein n=1 Tax=Triparma laevis f. inornata TaxID=1714386 RepID=A0A9W6ZY81_9STRA|nr:hypothetical protein TL16_g03391 [Triparma laevis f. inornata]
MCIPIDPVLAATLTKAPAKPSVSPSDNFTATAAPSSFLVVVIDDLYSIKSYVGLGYSAFLPVPLTGWMTKLNLLMDCPTPTTASAAGYQILSLDFESGARGSVKRLGALATQKIPSYCSSFTMSRGKAGTTLKKTLDDGDKFTATFRRHNSVMVDVKGTLASPSESEASFVKWVVERPHKFLLQKNGDLAWSPWGDGWKSDFSGCKKLVLEDGSSLEKLVESYVKCDEVFRACDFGNLFCFVQPSYEMVDCVNTKIS